MRASARVQTKEADMLRKKPSRGLIAVAACAVVALAVAAPAGAKTYAVKGTQTVVNEDQGIFKMRGGLVGKWNITSFEEAPIADSPYFHATGTELFKGCLNRGRGRSCKGDPSGTLSFTFEYWALFASPDPESLVWGSCWHPIVKGTGDFTGAQGVLTMVDTPTRNGVKTKYIGNVTLKGHSARRVARTAAASRSSCGSTS
jgi:hypothetical protein